MKYFSGLFLAFFSLMALAAPSRPARTQTPVVAPEITAFGSGTEHLLNMNLRRAERYLKTALRHKEDFAEAHNNLAFVLRKQGPRHFDDAYRHYQRAIELKPDLAEAHMYLGVLYVQKEDLDAARKTHARLKKLDASLADELAWVIENRREKEPAPFFGVVRSLK